MAAATCKICGKEFETKSDHAKYCSDRCMEKAAYSKNIECLKLKMQTGRKLSILEINELALSEHLSYGQFVAKYGI